MTRQIITEPRWPALLTMLAAALVFWALPPRLTVGPGWLLLLIVVLLVASITFSHRRGRHNVARSLTLVANALMTLALAVSLALLIQGLPAHHESPRQLLLAASALWFTNIFIFALWYWKLDAGGPLVRERSRGHIHSSFLFPQMIRPEGPGDWSPEFLDYLFLSFNTSTAFSPTDTPVVSRWAKVATMLQAMISLLIVVLLAARAVNIF